MTKKSETTFVWVHIFGKRVKRSSFIRILNNNLRPNCTSYGNSLFLFAEHGKQNDSFLITQSSTQITTRDFSKTIL